MLFFRLISKNNGHIHNGPDYSCRDALVREKNLFAVVKNTLHLTQDLALGAHYSQEGLPV